MKKTYTIIVCSDSHGSLEPLFELKRKYPNADCFLHCGDSQMPLDAIEQTGFLSVEGNCDWPFEYPYDRAIRMGSHKIFITHGHRQHADPYELAIQARAHGCDICCYGHTHCFDDQVVNDIQLLNPGSTKYNRDGSLPSYAVLELNGDNISITRHEF